MTDVWKDIFKGYIASYEAVKTLRTKDLIDEDEQSIFEGRILKDIITDMKSEVED